MKFKIKFCIQYQLQHESMSLQGEVFFCLDFFLRNRYRERLQRRKMNYGHDKILRAAKTED